MSRRRLGQHFLFDPSILSRIADAAGLSSDDTVVEIGPGPGTLTAILAERASRLIAIELDRGLYEKLKARFGGIPSVEIVHADALDYPFNLLGKFKVVANIPYYITTPIIFRLLEEKDRLLSMTLTIQKEVAERIVAGPGSKDYGVLSIMVQYLCDTEIAFFVPKGAFRPVPKVDSAVIRLVVRERPLVTVSDEQLFFRVVKTAFSQRRKMLSNSLKGLGPSVVAALEEAGVDPMRRPETLGIGEFAGISETLFDMKKL